MVDSDQVDAVVDHHQPECDIAELFWGAPAPRWETLGAPEGGLSLCPALPQRVSGGAWFTSGTG